MWITDKERLGRLISPCVSFGVMTTTKTSRHEHFERFPDHRINRNKKHRLSDILILSILAVICGAESWDSIESFGKTKLSFLRSFLKLPNGIPSYDTINRVFSSIRPKYFESALIVWVDGIRDQTIKTDPTSIVGKAIGAQKETHHQKNRINRARA